jgi:phosphonate transport system substrate-binding protein
MASGNHLRPWAAAIVALWIAGCSDERATPIDLSRREAIDLRREETAVTYAYLPQYAHRVSYRRQHQLLEYLRRQTGLELRQVFPDTFDEHMRLVQQGKVDISFTNPFVYVKMARRFGNLAFAQVVEVYGQNRFRGQIICRADNPAIQGVADLRGKRIIAVDPSSAGGYLYPLGYLKGHGIAPQDLAEIAFAPGPGGKQEKVVLAVHAGRFDAGMIREGTLNVVADKLDLAQIRILASSDWYPGWVLSSRRGLDPQVSRRIGEALQALSYEREDHRRLLDLADAKGFIPTDDGAFDSVRELMGQLELSPDS